MTVTDSELGLHFIVGLDKPTLSNTEAKLLEKISPLGIIIFAKNIDVSSHNWTQGLQYLIRDAKEASRRKDLIISIDHEGGRVNRLPPPTTSFPYARSWAEKAYEVGDAMGKELRALGFNLSFSPVLDINSEPLNEVIGPRSFSEVAENIFPSANAFCRGLEKQGLLCCGKHFPGHGATIEDSHFELPVLSCDRQSLKNRELVPFSQSIAASIPLLMTAHVLFPEIDPDNPGTLSKVILQDILRDELGDKGVVISDDLEMKALADLSDQEIALRAINAGVDILLVGNRSEGHPLEAADDMYVGLSAALADGRIDPAKLLESKTRIHGLLEKSRELIASSEYGKNYKMELLGCQDHCTLKSEIEANTETKNT